MVPHIDSYISSLYTWFTNSSHQHIVTPNSFPHRRKILCSVEDPGEYKVIKDGTKLEDCGSVEVEMGNGEVGATYEKDC